MDQLEISKVNALFAQMSEKSALSKLSLNADGQVKCIAKAMPFFIQLVGDKLRFIANLGELDDLPGSRTEQLRTLARKNYFAVDGSGGYLGLDRRAGFIRYSKDQAIRELDSHRLRDLLNSFIAGALCVKGHLITLSPQPSACLDFTALRT